MRRIKERCFVALLQSQTITVDKGLGIRLKVNAHDKIQLMGVFFWLILKLTPIAVSQLVCLYSALKVCTLFAKKMGILLSASPKSMHVPGRTNTSCDGRERRCLVTLAVNTLLSAFQLFSID